LTLIVLLFAWIIWSGWRVTRGAGHELRPCAAALTAFAACIALNSFKGWQLDLDPINVYFWVFAGILGRIGRLQHSRSRHSFTRNIVPDTVAGPAGAAMDCGRAFRRRMVLDAHDRRLHIVWRA
jgi:hypothetical protein